MPTLTPAELTERAAYIGGSDVAALFGLSRWARPIDVFYDKRPDLAPAGWGDTPPSKTMALGHLLEPVVADLFTEATGTKLRRWTPSVRCREHPWEGGHIDRRGADGSVYEGKWSMRPKEWGPVEDGPAGVPRQYLVQLLHYLHVTQAEHGWMGVLLGYGDFRVYRIPRDPALEGTIVAMNDAFWHDHVEPGIPPEPDGTDNYTRALNARYPVSEELTAVATIAQQQLVLELKAIREGVLEPGVREEARIVQLLKDQMATTDRLDGPGWSITWRTTAPKPRVMWAEVAVDLADELAAALGAPGGAPGFILDAQGRHTEPVTPARPFRLTFTDEEV